MDWWDWVIVIFIILLVLLPPKWDPAIQLKQWLHDKKYGPPKKDK